MIFWLVCSNCRLRTFSIIFCTIWYVFCSHTHFLFPCKFLFHLEHFLNNKASFKTFEKSSRSNISIITCVALIRISNGELVTGFNFKYLSYFNLYCLIFLFSTSLSSAWFCLRFPPRPPRPLPPPRLLGVEGGTTIISGTIPGSAFPPAFPVSMPGSNSWIGAAKFILEFTVASLDTSLWWHLKQIQSP